MSSPRIRDSRGVELRLELTPQDAERLLSLPALRALVGGSASRRRLHTTYFDTRDLDLYRGGVLLRLRERDGEWTQTLMATSANAAGLVERREIEWPVGGGEPDLGRVAEAGLHWANHAEALRDGRPLEPAIETEVQRTTVPISWPDSELALSIDVGRMRARNDRLPVAEATLELRSGSVAALHQVALALCEDVALHVAARHEGARGFDRLTGERRLRRAGSLDHAADATLEDVIAAVLDDCTAQIVENREIAMAGDEAEGVHQLRVGARRLRSALALFKKVLPDPATSALRDELRWLGGELGPARDLDVLVHERLRPLLERQPDDGGLKRLCDEAMAAREEAYGRVREALSSPRFGRLVIRLGGILATRGWRDQPLSPEAAAIFAPARPKAARLLEKRYESVLGAGDDPTRLDPTELHSLRIRLKKLRYATEFLGNLFEGTHPGSIVKRLRRLQNVLGHLNDDVTARRLVDRLIERMGPEAGAVHQRAAGFVLGWIAHERVLAFEQLDRCFGRFTKARPFWR